MTNPSTATPTQQRKKNLNPALPAAICLSILSSQAAAQSESITVTRKTIDLYGVQGDEVLLMTAGCEVYALATPAQLLPESGRMMLKFDAGTANNPDPKACELRDMLTPQVMPRGRYEVKLSYDSADWYGIAGTNLLLRTVGCQRRSAGEPAVWFQPMEGKGVIEYRSGAACSSDGVFGSLRRQARSKAAAAQGR